MMSKFLIFIALLFLFAAGVFGQNGGIYEITEAVVASGGGQNSAGGVFSLDSTTGQSLAGNALNHAPFAVTSGFWNFTALAPSAASVTLGGRVRTASGSGIRNVWVLLTSPSGETRSTFTGTFGSYRFEGVLVGGTYIVSVTSKKYTFNQPSIVRSVLEEISDLDFVADFQ